MAKAIGTMLGQLDALLVFLSDGRIQPDNNWVEQELRLIAVGGRDPEAPDVARDAAWTAV